MIVFLISAYDDDDNGLVMISYEALDRLICGHW